MSSVLKMREAGAVERCHTTPHAMRFTVAQHTFNMLCMLRHFFPAARKELWEAVLEHDLAERWTGDVPGYVKHMSTDLSQGFAFLELCHNIREGYRAHGKLTDDEKRILRELDKLELFLWCEDELAMGNTMVLYMHGKVREMLLKYAQEPIRGYVEQFTWTRSEDDAL